MSLKSPPKKINSAKTARHRERKRLCPDVSVDPRIELLSAVQILAKDAVPLSFPYVREAESYFQPFKKHPVVALYNKATQSGMDSIIAVTLMIHCSAPPELHLDLEPHPWTGYDTQRAALREQLPGLVEALSDFARETKFSAFFGGNTEFYQRCVDLFARDTRGLDYAGWLEEYTGMEFNVKFTVLLAPLQKRGLKSDHVHGYEHLISIIAPERISRGRPEFRFLHPWKFWHELSSTMLDPLANGFPARIKQSERLWKPVESDCNGISSWKHCIQEHISKCVSMRVLARAEAMGRLPPSPAPEIPGIPYAQPVLESLQRFELKRKRYRSLKEFYPELLDVFTEMAARS